MSAILRIIGALALLSGAVALPHPDAPVATPSPTVPVTPATSPSTTPPPSTSSLPLGEVPYTGDCDLNFCNSLGTSVCVYWGGITGWDSMHNPRPGETMTMLGPCSYSA
ncbi:hypothetical protein F4818DRAFT_209000 [Hypoxylon cercidicola]|nr:hypothetical protein F4818DRAFT_209000 [Hypoxylon cercidicola]